MANTDTPTSPVFDAIYDFNERVIGLPVQIPLNVLSPEQYAWTQKFCLEELDELAVAYEKQDIVGMVDAVLDLIYGAFGTNKKMGLTRDQAFACMMAVHRANMTKKRGRTARGSEEDATKPEDFVPPEAAIGEILFGEGTHVRRAP